MGLPIGLRRAGPRPGFAGDRYEWRTPRLTLLEAPYTSRARRILLRANGAYLLVAGVLLVVRIAQLAAS